MKVSELEKILKKHGCKVWREGAGHTIWIAPNGNKFTVGRHKSKDVPPGTLKSILKDAGIE